MSEDFSLVPGSRFLVDYGSDETMAAVFRGLSIMGGETAMVFQKDDGVLRYIPSSKIVFMDLLEAMCPVSNKPKDSGREYYG